MHEEKWISYWIYIYLIIKKENRLFVKLILSRTFVGIFVGIRLWFVGIEKLTEGVEHPAPFPEKIVILPVLQTTNEGDLVLDLFCGSMTTGKVSQRFNRQFVGYDVQVYWVFICL